MSPTEFEALQTTHIEIHKPEKDMQLHGNMDI